MYMYVYLVRKCLQQVAINKDESFRLVAPIAMRDFFVDDCLTGAGTKSEAIALQNHLIQLLGKGCFKLRKWCSGDPNAFECIPVHLR